MQNIQSTAPLTVKLDSLGHTTDLSKSVSMFKVLWVTTIKDLRIARRYLPDLIGSFIEVVIRVAVFFLLANVVTLHGKEGTTQGLTGQELFIFFQGALLLFLFKGVALWTPISGVNRDLHNGTLEFIYSNPCSRFAYYLGNVLSGVIISQPVFIPLYFFLVFFAGANYFNMFMILVACAVTVINLMFFGIMISLAALLWRQAMSIGRILDIAFEFVAGAYFPIYAFPVALQYFAYILPYTWGYDLVRYYSFQGNWPTILPVWQEWTILIVYAIFYAFLAIYLLKRVERHAKQQGLHLI